MYISPLQLLKNIVFFYYEGFKNLTLGKTLWKIIILKLVIMFAVFKLLFFSDTLGTRYSTDEERSSAVLENLTKDTQ